MIGIFNEEDVHPHAVCHFGDGGLRTLSRMKTSVSHLPRTAVAGCPIHREMQIAISISKLHAASRFGISSHHLPLHAEWGKRRAFRDRDRGATRTGHFPSSPISASPVQTAALLTAVRHWIGFEASAFFR